MIILSVTFKPNTSIEWAAEQLRKLGFSSMELGQTAQEMKFILVFAIDRGNQGFVCISAEREEELTRAINLISPQILSVKRA